MIGGEREMDADPGARPIRVSRPGLRFQPRCP